jgi:pimeloyl-ACP methyl ester carboxylesterase
MQEQKITIEGLEINYKTIGKGLPILILHGWGVGSEAWVGVAEVLAGNGFRVIVPDMPGFGKSDAPEMAWNVDNYVDWVKIFSKTLNLDKFVLMGHSFGGQVAAKFCAVYPDKVDKLILCAAAVIRKPRLGSRQQLAKHLSKAKVFLRHIPFGIYPVLRKVVYKIAGTKDYSQLQGVMAQTFLNVVKESVLDSAKKITVPTLIVWGDKDKETPPEDAHELNSSLINSKLITISGAGHKLHRTHTAELVRLVVDFLKAERTIF